MNNNNHIHRLIEKFMEGDTSLREEQELYRYFSGNSIAEDLLPLRTLFTGLSTLPKRYGEKTFKKHSSKETETLRPLLIRGLFRWSAAAAVALLLLLGGTAVYRSLNYSEVIVYGHKADDPTLLHHEMASTMQQLDMQPESSIKAQLDDVLLGQD